MITDRDKATYRAIGAFSGLLSVAKIGCYDTREKLLAEMQHILDEYKLSDPYEQPASQR